MPWLLLVGVSAVAVVMWGRSNSAITSTSAASNSAASSSPESVRPPFERTIPNQAKPISEAPHAMIWIPGGEVSMGSQDPTRCLCGGHEAMPDARPVHRVYVDGFWVDQTDVTNEQFQKFVEATGYLTVAEKAPTREEFPTAPAENLVGGSTVFTPTLAPVKLNNYLQWWSCVVGASWRHPEGPASDIKGRER